MAIVKQRRNFEYRLKRRIVKKIDFIRYIEYEMNLEALRQKRVRRMMKHRRHADSTVTTTTSTTTRKELPMKHSDHAIIRRIHFIFDRAVNKFKGDLDLWQRYVEFAKSTGAKKALGRIYSKCTQLLPREPRFWIDASFWEFEHQNNIYSARGMNDICEEIRYLWG
jgi:U3 small nucleolar RNA-associated protein 6